MHSHATTRPQRLRLPQDRRLRAIPRLAHPGFRTAATGLDSIPPRPQPHPYRPEAGEHSSPESHLPDFHLQQEYPVFVDAHIKAGEVPASAARATDQLDRLRLGDV